MDPHILIFVVVMFMYAPLACILVYVWYKYGKGDKNVALAQTIFLVGTVSIIGYMLTLAL